MALGDRVLADYRRHLDTEIDRVASHLHDTPRVGHLHWGGGTPSILGAEGLSRTLESLSAHFAIHEGAEHAIELDPRSVTPDLARGLAKLGVNRASLGVQDLEPAVQVAIGRVQPLAVVERAFEALRGAGLTRINVDLIYGLPMQTRASVAEPARQIADLGPDRVACYGYAHLPRRKRNQRLIDASLLPDPVERFHQARAIAAVFLEAGYEAVGLDHYAKPEDAIARSSRSGRLRRNFQGYTDDGRQTLVGLGASAVSRMRQGFVQNLANPEAYAFALSRGHLAAARGYRLTQEDLVRGAIIEALMCAFMVDLKTWGPHHRCDAELARLDAFARDGLLVENEGVIAMTEAGRPFVRVVAAVFDPYRSEPTENFIIAV